MSDDQHQPCPKPTSPFQLQSLVRAKGPTLILPPCPWGIEQERTVMVHQAWQENSAAGMSTDQPGCAGCRDVVS